MTTKEFIKKYGSEELKATSNFATKSLGVNYDVKDAFIEFGDNAYDSRIKNSRLEFNISIDAEKHTITFYDNGSGIKDDTKLFLLGGTNKESNKNKIGKYGIGVPGATAAIATQCKFNKNEIVEAIFESASEGKSFIKHTAFMPNGEMINGKTVYEVCDKSKHFTRLTFTNVLIRSVSPIIDSMEEIFEIPLHKNMDIIFNGRKLGMSTIPTFIGDEIPKTIMVGDIPVEVRYRIIGGNKSDDSRALKEAGLRIYDKNSGRLLAKSQELWKWFCNKQAFQDICGCRAGIFIDSTIEAYKKFGIKSSKNGVTYRLYCQDPDFKNLVDELKMIYGVALSTNCSNRISNVDEIVKGTRKFQISPLKIDGLYLEASKDAYIIKKKYSQDEIVSMIDTIIDLQDKLNNRRSKKSKTAEA